MANQTFTNIDENLRLGIEAARGGDEKRARAYLIAVLKQNPNHIPAMLWLAFVLPSPEDTVRVLKRVLSLDPDNERARAGIRWARGRLGLDPDQPGVVEEAAPADPAEDETDDVFDRQQFLSGKIRKQAKKGVLAHRARRTIKPLLVIILVTGVLGLASIGLGALALVPPETLAAWLPAQALKEPVDAATTRSGPALAAGQSPQTLSPAPILATGSDTLAMVSGQAAQPPGLLSPGDRTLPQPVTRQPGLDPAIFLGPELVSVNPSLQVPVDNLSPVHQPAYPGEKWIEVNLTTQQLVAWEGDVPVFSFLASTGLPNTPTVTGEYNIYWKLEKTLMTGPGYYLPEVPYTMYFYGGYALHGTYWHNNFGQPMSHGCVNLETGNAQKLFEWAEPVIPPGQTQVTASAENPGTLVVVHQ